MIEGTVYSEIVKKYFSFLSIEFHLKLSLEKIVGNFFYDLQYKDEKVLISISYENAENYFIVNIFLLENGVVPDYDDKTKTLHLDVVSRKVFSIASENEIKSNNIYFNNILPRNELEKKLLKSAKELRLCLNHFNDLSIT